MIQNRKSQQGVFIGVFALATLVVISLAISFMSNRVNELLAGQSQMISGKQAYWLAYSGMEIMSTEQFAVLDIAAGTSYSLAGGIIEVSSNASASLHNGAPRTNEIITTGKDGDSVRKIKWTLGNPTNYARYFDGAGDYITIADDNALDFGSGALSYSVWFRPAEVKLQQVLGKRNTAADANYELKLGADGSINAEIVGNRISATTTYSVNNWYHVAFTRSSTVTGYCELYVNGIREGTATHEGDVDNNEVFMIGDDPVSGSQFFNGIINAPAIWNTKLDEDEIQTLYIQAPAFNVNSIQSGSIRGYWKFDESGSTLNDETANNNDGSATNTERTGI